MNLQIIDCVEFEKRYTYVSMTKFLEEVQSVIMIMPFRGFMSPRVARVHWCMTLGVHIPKPLQSYLHHWIRGACIKNSNPCQVETVKSVSIHRPPYRKSIAGICCTIHELQKIVIPGNLYPQ